MPSDQQSTSPEYNQSSFIGGMNLLLDDTNLQPNQYRVGFNVRNRYDNMNLILSSKEDLSAPVGIKQELLTFGNFVILFVAGKAYYKYYTSTFWTNIPSFGMSVDAPRYWTKAIPISQTNFYRIAATKTVSGNDFSDSNGSISANNIAGASKGNLPGLLVQDNINQPQFIFLDNTGIPIARKTQKFEDWSIKFTDGTNTVVADDGDNREYVPIGNSMEWVDGVLYIVSPDFNSIYRSVSGRPLDFVVNVTNTLAGSGADFKQVGGGDATTTSYSVGVGGITCIRALADGSLFVAASNANFSVSNNTTPGAPTLFGEYTFIRRFLFNSNCLSDRAIFDSTGDTRFIDLTGVRSFNSILQTQNEGRNTVFTSRIRPAFGSEQAPLIQNPNAVACILYNDYELYSLETLFGPAIAVYDTINSCWVGFDTDQSDGQGIKIFAKIELAVQVLFAVTSDNRVFRLYAGPDEDEASFRTNGICSNATYYGENIKLAYPKLEIQTRKIRTIVNNITEDCECSVTPYVNNRISANGKQTKNLKYIAPSGVTVHEIGSLSDTDSMLQNLLFSTPNCEQGWKMFCLIEWNSGSINQFSVEFNNVTPMNPTLSQ